MRIHKRLRLGTELFTLRRAAQQFDNSRRKQFGTLDHRNLNEVLPFNPTAENIAHWIVQSIPECYRADVQESRNNLATYVKDDDDAEGE